MDIKVNLSNIMLYTERLVLRSWRETDINDFYAYASQPGVGEMAGWPHHHSKRASKKILAAFINDKTAFAIVHRRDNRVIGSVGLHMSWTNDDNRYKHLRAKEIGYVLSKDYWGHGFTTEAVRVVIDFCFTDLDVDALACGHFVDNNRSRRVIEKCGFTYVMESEYYAKQLKQYFHAKRYILMNTSEQHGAIPATQLLHHAHMPSLTAYTINS